MAGEISGDGQLAFDIAVMRYTIQQFSDISEYLDRLGVPQNIYPVGTSLLDRVMYAIEGEPPDVNYQSE